MVHMRKNRDVEQDRCYHLISRVAHRAFEGGQAANRKGYAAMTRKTYCGNLLWQSGLLVPAWPGGIRLRQHRFSAIGLSACRATRPRFVVARHSPVAKRSGCPTNEVRSLAKQGRKRPSANLPAHMEPYMWNRDDAANPRSCA